MTPPILQWTPFTGSLAERLAHLTAKPAPGEVAIYWLGQAGFVIDFGEYRILIDPYLSDSLAQKYKGTAFGHVRMMAAPIAPEQFSRLDLVLCTHRHTDHMDPATLQPLAARFPHLRFVVPAASIDEAGKRCGVGRERLLPVNAGDDLEIMPGLRLRPLPSAHESLDINAAGEHEWLGYVLDVAGALRLYHSGDCIPYPGLAETLAELKPDVALLPVNGRDLERSGNGVPGNFTLDEAVALCVEAGIPALVAHHYGLFDFNTVAPEVIDARARSEQKNGKTNGLNLLRARTGGLFHAAGTCQ